MKGRSPKEFPWHEPQWTERLAALHKRALSASKIAKQLSEESGRTLRRGAVIGKLRRLKLMPEGENATGRGLVTALKKKRPRPFESGFQALRNGPRKPPSFPKLTRRQKDFILGVPLEALSDHRCGCLECMSLGPRIDPQKCKWPLDDPEPGKEFCGARQMEGLPYCEAHSALAYTGGYQAAMRRQDSVIRDAVERLRSR